eukprot:3987751-Pleurochrysis_carterae.AAC.5
MASFCPRDRFLMTETVHLATLLALASATGSRHRPLGLHALCVAAGFVGHPVAFEVTVMYDWHTRLLLQAVRSLVDIKPVQRTNRLAALAAALIAGFRSISSARAGVAPYTYEIQLSFIALERGRHRARTVSKYLLREAIYPPTDIEGTWRALSLRAHDVAVRRPALWLCFLPPTIPRAAVLSCRECSWGVRGGAYLATRPR